MLELKNVNKTYRPKKGAETKALVDVSIAFPDRGLVFILGKSGCGKSTLLNVIGGLDKPDSGEISIMGRSSKDFSSTDFDSYRNTFVGFVFQEYNILNEFSVEDNIAIATELQGKKRDRALIKEILGTFELEGLEYRKPSTLSGGQKQRVAIARALVKNPRLILADEPTGSLDSETGKEVLNILKKLSTEKLVIVVSHDREFAEEYADRIVEMKDGKVIADYSVSAGGEREPTTSEQGEKTYSDDEKKLIRSRLPIRHAIRLGLGSIKTKPVRLVFTVLLTAAAFILFGVFSTLALYDKEAVTEKAITDRDISYLKYGKGYNEKEIIYGVQNSDEPFVYLRESEYVVPTGLTEEEYLGLAEKYPSAVAVIDMPIAVENLTTDTFFYSEKYSGVAFAADNGASLNILAGRIPENSGEAMIPSFMFDAVKAGKMFNATHSLIELDGYEDYVKLPPQKLHGDIGVTVVGVYESAPISDKYLNLKTMADNGTLKYRDTDWNGEYAEGFYNYLFIHKDLVGDFYSEYKDWNSYNGDEASDANYFLRSLLTVKLVYGDGENDSYDLNEICPYPNNIGAETLPVYDVTGTRQLDELGSGEIALPGVYYARVLYEYLFDALNEIMSLGAFSQYYGYFEQAINERGAEAVYEEFEEVADKLDMLYRNTEAGLTVTEARGILKAASDYFAQYSLPLPRFTMTSFATGETYEVKVAGVFHVNYRRLAAYVSNDIFKDILTRADEFNIAYGYETEYKAADNADITAVFIPKSEYLPALGELVASVYVTDSGDDSTNMIFCALMTEIIGVNEAIAMIFKVVLGLWLGLSVFAILLMFSLVSASITAKKKDIGILRALGARGTDVFAVFLVEALIIAVVCFVVAGISCAFVCPAVSDIFVSTNMLHISLLVFGIENAALLAVLALVTAVLATAIPVARYTGKPPVDSIRGL